MQSKTNKIGIVILVLVISILAVHIFIPPYLEKSMNRVYESDHISYSDTTREFHDGLTIMDWHADTTLWSRDLLSESAYGHVDIPRMQTGNVAIQMFTTVTKVPKGLNYEANSASATDQITQLAIVQGWPLATWNSLFERALYQASLIKKASIASPDFHLITNRSDLENLLQWRSEGLNVVGGLIGTEGGHPVEGSTLKVADLFDAGFRMISLHHFFDNRLGGSLHGLSGDGLTDFGRSMVAEIEKYQIILDVSHSSPAVVEEVLEITTRPVVVSHTGVYGHCPRKRNLPDELMLEIAARGGLIAIGFWEEAVCGTTVADIASAIHYAIDLVGVDHVALGSDFDGAVTTPIDSSQMIALTDALIKDGLTRKEIAQVMGSNSINFLRNNLPR